MSVWSVAMTIFVILAYTLFMSAVMNEENKFDQSINKKQK